MKKFLLVIVAAFVVSAVSAQVARKSLSSPKAAKVQKISSATQMQKVVMVSAKDTGESVWAGNVKKAKKFSIPAGVAQSFKAAKSGRRVARAGEVQNSYTATGIDPSGDNGATPVTWTMKSVTSEDGALALVDMVPNCFGYEDGVFVEYTLNGSTITIKPQLVASVEDKGYYMFLMNNDTEDGTIKLTLGDDGSITSESTLNLVYGVFSSNAFDATFETYLGYWQYTKNVKYRLPGTAPSAPVVSFRPSNTVLFAGLGVSGYGYNANIGMMGAYATTSFTNQLVDYVSEWDWSAVKNGESTVQDQGLNFAIDAVGGDSYSNITLKGANEGVWSDPYVLGAGKTRSDDGSVRFENCHLYAGELASSFEYSDGTTATMTVQDPDGDLMFYTNWGTPDIYTKTSITKIYSYQGKPSAPLYIEGVVIPMVSFATNGDFHLKISLYKCSRSASGNLTLGDLIAQSDATSKNVVDTYASKSGLTNIEFDGFYVEDEFGMSEDISYLFIEDEFVICIEDWDNGSFSGVLGAQNIDVSDIPYSYFARTGYPDEFRRYTTWFPQLLIGLKGAAYGYLHTEDNTNVTIPIEGGETSIHIKPMLYSVDSETSEPQTRLFLADESDEIPEWLNIAFANENYSDSFGFDLVFSAEATSASRSCNLVFFQEGAKLEVTVSQGDDGTGINTVITKIDNNAASFNMAGQRVNDNFKGIVVKNGRKVVVK